MKITVFEQIAGATKGIESARLLGEELAKPPVAALMLGLDALNKPIETIGKLPGPIADTLRFGAGRLIANRIRFGGKV